MDFTISTRVRRILKGLQNASLQEDNSKQLCNEEFIGIYHNHDDTGDSILFKTRGLVISYNGNIEYLEYEAIDCAKMPDNKCNITGFYILSKNKEYWLPVRGNKNHRHFDAFEIIRLIDRILEDIKVCRNNGSISEYLCT